MIRKPLTYEEFVKNNPEEVDSEGRTRLMRVMKEPFINKELLKQLVAHEKDNINAKDKHGRTAVIHAVHYAANPDVLAFLADQGADVNAVDEDRRSALHHEADSSCFSEARLIVLLDHNANPLALDKNGQIPLQLAKKHVLAFYKDATARLEKATQEAQEKRAKTMAKQMDWYTDRSGK